MKKNLPTPAGLSKSLNRAGKQQTDSQLIDVINQIFALFELNYHNQYYKALPSKDKENSLKRLWVNALQSFSPAIILLAAENVIKESEFFPTIKTMIDSCHAIILGDHLPDVRSAYQQACSAPYPKEQHNWSHPLVYYAGAQTGWFFLDSNLQSQTFPFFKTNFERLCNQFAKGDILELPEFEKQQTDPDHEVLTTEDALQQLQLLQKNLS